MRAVTRRITLQSVEEKSEQAMDWLIDGAKDYGAGVVAGVVFGSLAHTIVTGAAIAVVGVVVVTCSIAAVRRWWSGRRHMTASEAAFMADTFDMLHKQQESK